MILKYLEIAFLCEKVLTILSLSTQRQKVMGAITERYLICTTLVVY